MSLINDLLTSISKNPGITAQELADELKQDLNRVRNNLYVNTNLVTKKRDDVTRRPGYHLTAEGKAKLKTGAADLADAPEPTTAAAPVVTAEPAPAPATESILPRAEVSPIHALQALRNRRQGLPSISRPLRTCACKPSFAPQRPHGTHPPPCRSATSSPRPSANPAASRHDPTRQTQP